MGAEGGEDLRFSEWPEGWGRGESRKDDGGLGEKLPCLGIRRRGGRTPPGRVGATVGGAAGEEKPRKRSWMLFCASSPLVLR
jgi:hypothetical protein